MGFLASFAHHLEEAYCKEARAGRRQGVQMVFAGWRRVLESAAQTAGRGSGAHEVAVPLPAGGRHLCAAQDHRHRVQGGAPHILVSKRAGL